MRTIHQFPKHPFGKVDDIGVVIRDTGGKIHAEIREALDKKTPVIMKAVNKHAQQSTKPTKPANEN